MTPAPLTVGAYVLGSPTSRRDLVRHADLLTAYADGLIEDEREAYLSHFAFGADMREHYAANRHSVAGFAGACSCRWLIFDIDRADLVAAVADARRLVTAIHERYPELDKPVWFSGSKGFHVAVELTHKPPSAVGFHRVARTFAERLAAHAGVTIDTSIYDLAHIIRLPNTKHPKTGLFKRRVDAEALFALDVDGIRRHAMQPAGDGIPSARTPSPRLEADWREAEAATHERHEARNELRAVGRIDKKAPRYFIEFLRFGTDEGQRHATLFRCAAWLTEQGAPPSLCRALLTEAGCDVGLALSDVERQIRCGIEHATKQRAAAMPDPHSYEEALERWAIQHESDPKPLEAFDFPFGALTSEGGPP